MNHDTNPFAIKKLSDVNHITHAPKPNTPPKAVNKKPATKATIRYRNKAATTTYIMKGNTKILANANKINPTIVLNIKTITPTQTKNNKIARATNARPPVKMNGLAKIKKGRKFHKYCSGRVTIKSGRTPKF